MWRLGPSLMPYTPRGLPGAYRIRKIANYTQRSDVILWSASIVPDVIDNLRRPASPAASRGDDLVDKVTEYQAVDSIKQYLIIDSTRHWVRCFTRNADSLFVAPKDHVGGLLEIASIGYVLDIDGLYRESGI